MNILLVGEHPQGISGNSHMMAATVRQIDTSKHNVAVFAAGMFRNVKLIDDVHPRLSQQAQD